MFPYIATQHRLAFSPADTLSHDWIILVCRGGDLQFPLIQNQPGPATAESPHARGFEFFFECFKTAKRGFDVISQFVARRPARIRTNYFPKHGMVCMTASVVAHHPFYIRG